MGYEHVSYMLDLAGKLKEIKHSDSDVRFYRISGVANLEELLQNSGAKSPIIVVDDNQEGGFSDNDSDNMLDTPYNSFYVMAQVGDILSMSERHTALVNCKAIIKKILSKMFKDRIDCVNGLNYLDRTNIRYFTVGPIGMQWFGIQVGFTVVEYPAIVYNVADWE